MNYNSIPRGYIATDNNIFRKNENGVYTTGSDTFCVNLLILPPECVRGQFRKALKMYKEKDTKVMAPCMIEKKAYTKHTDNTYYWTRPIVPPGTNKNSKFFLPELIVPCVYIHDSVKIKNGGMGYIMVSEYLGGQKLFVDGNKIRDDTTLQENMFHAVIKATNSETEGKNPLVILLREPLSKEIIKQNRDEISHMERLQRKNRTNDMFWWDI